MDRQILTKKEARELPGLSPAAKKLIDLEGTEVLGIKEGKNLLAYAVLSAPAYGEKRILNHIYLSDTANEDSLIDLYGYLGSYCLDLDLDRIICRFIDTIDKLNTIHGMMIWLPQIPLLLNGHRMVYDIKKIKVEAVLNAHPNIEKLLSFVKEKKDVGGVKYNRFFEELKRNGRPPSTVTQDDEYDRFFEYKNHVIAYLNGFRAGEETLIITDSYVSDKKMQSYAMPAMMISLLEKLEKDKKKVKKLIVQAYEEPVYRGIIDMLGNPETDELIFEYVMMF